MNYTKISDRVGWDKREVPIPPISEIATLSGLALDGDEKSQEHIIAITRFNIYPHTFEEGQSLAIAKETLGLLLKEYRDGTM